MAPDSSVVPKPGTCPSWTEWPARLRRWDRVIFVLGIALVLAVLGLFIIAWNDARDKAIADRAAQSESLAATNKLIHQIDDCLDPAGKCAKASAARTGNLVGEPEGPINTVAVYAVICGQSNTGEKAILDCVNKKVAKATG